MERTHSVDTTKKVGEKVLVQGWVASIRDHGKLLFVDLRDYFGKVQIVFDSEVNPEMFETAKQLGMEYVIGVEGNVMERSSELRNERIATGDIEISATSLEILNKSKPLPFPIDTDGQEIDENARLKYRFIDIRRDRLKQHMRRKADFLLAVRNHMTEEGFLEVITPLLTSTSPEGARDFIIPSRLFKGKFFVLPQAPQQFKQLLMVGGVDKYFQIAPCARDEDPRADRHAGVFYQIDIEMSFPTQDRLFAACEKLLINTYKVVAPDKEIVTTPFPRIPYKESMARFGTDKPDIRFGLELKDITEVVKGRTEFNVFNSAKMIKAIVAESCGEWSRTQIAELEEYAKNLGAKGLAFAKVTESGLDTGVAKFIEPVQTELISSLGAKPGDLLFFCADEENMVNKVLANVRNELGTRLGLRDPQKLSFVWITDFPFYEMDDKTGKLDFGHNPFSMPKGGLKAFEVEDPLQIETVQYDLALNGYEILSGSIRNHDPEVLVKAFETIGYGREDVIRRFGAMYNAFQYGAPPHGGWAIGIDRLFMILIDEANIRDTYAFPMSSNGTDLMMNAPSEIPDEDLRIVGIELRTEVKAALERK